MLRERQSAQCVNYCTLFDKGSFRARNQYYFSYSLAFTSPTLGGSMVEFFVVMVALACFHRFVVSTINGQIWDIFSPDISLA